MNIKPIMKNTLSLTSSGLFLIVLIILCFFCLLKPSSLSAEPSQKALIESSPNKNGNEQYVIRSIDGNVLKYNIKISVWEKEGYIQKFNKLALSRGSSLTNDIAETRAKLRLKRQRLTQFINYPLEAEAFLLRQMINDFLKEKWNMVLLQVPQGINIKKAVSSIKILEMQEDKKYIRLSLKAKIDSNYLKNRLLELGYQFTPTKVQLYCSNLYGEFKDQFIDAICRKSEYMKNQSRGLYEIYTTVENFAGELSNIMIGPYLIYIDEVTKNKITFSTKIQSN